MERRIAELLGAGEGRVNLKVTSTDHLGFVGREEGIAALAVALLVKAEAGA
jgi:2-C-methyl-D-erythritol 2,4-cyclodiphosphate synthase